MTLKRYHFEMQFDLELKCIWEVQTIKAFSNVPERLLLTLLMNIRWVTGKQLRLTYGPIISWLLKMKGADVHLVKEKMGQRLLRLFICSLIVVVNLMIKPTK